MIVLGKGVQSLCTPASALSSFLTSFEYLGLFACCLTVIIWSVVGVSYFWHFIVLIASVFTGVAMQLFVSRLSWWIFVVTRQYRLRDILCELSHLAAIYDITVDMYLCRPNIVAVALCFRSVRGSVHLCVTESQTLLARYLGICWWNLTKLLPLTDFGARMNASNFGVKRSRSRWSLICPKMHFLPCHMLADA